MRTVAGLLLLLSALGLSAQEHTYAISGQVILDNGVAVPNAEVGVTHHGWDEVTDPVLTDAQGRFSFSGLPAGQFVLTAHRNDLGSFFYGQSPQPGIVIGVELNERHPQADVNFRIDRPAVIEGVVRSYDGNPLSSVQVYGKRRALANGKSVPIVEGVAFADETGHYRLSVHRGRYRFCASAQAGLDSVVPVGYATFGQQSQEVYGESCQPVGPIAVNPGQKIAFDLTLATRSGVEVAGTVTNAPPNSGSMVQLIPREAGGLAINGAVDGSNQTFQMKNVPPGQYWLTAQAAVSENGTALMLLGRQPLIVGPGGASGVELKLNAPPVVNVVIHVPKNVTGLEVGLRDLSQPNGQPIMAQHQGDGSLRIPLPFPGRYRLVTRSSGCPVSATFGNVDALASAIDVPGGSTETLEATVTDQCGLIKGKVINEAGKAVPLARMLILLSGTPQDPGDLIQESAEKDGTFEFNGLRPGPYLLWAWDELDEWNGFVEDLASMVQWQTAVTVKAGETTSVDLPQLRALAKERK